MAILVTGGAGYIGSHMVGGRFPQFLCHSRVGAMPLVEGAGNLVEIAANPAVLGCELPDSGEQLVID